MSVFRVLEAIAPLGIMGAGFTAAIFLRQTVRIAFGDHYERSEAILRQRHEFSDEWERALAIYQIPPTPTNHAPYIPGSAFSNKAEDIYRPITYGLEDYFKAKEEQQ